ncbi:MAG TPA: RnfABCDGE type electron transport complex subunit G [Lachnospiraceae bacterium]|nr:RnfABCDGE type electron transport complex subunit G [Lachnospiraceae bacterium]
MKKMFQETLILFVITMCSGLMLGFIYNITKEPIRVQQEKTKLKACKEVFQDAVNFEGLEGFNEIIDYSGLLTDIKEVIVAYDVNNSEIGYVFVITTHEGYNGDITFSMGVTRNGVLNGISITSISETAGLGMKAEEVLQPQFSNKEVDEFVYTKSGATFDNQIDAISGATITTNAITNGVNAGLNFFQIELQGGSQNE